MGIASLVMAIIGLVLSFLEPVIGVIVGVVGTILASTAKKNKEKFSTAGLIISIIDIVLSIIVFISMILIMIINKNPLNNLAEETRRETFSIVADYYMEELDKKVLSNEISCTNSTKNLNESDFKKIKSFREGDYYIFIATDEEVITSNFSDFPIEIAKQAGEQSADGINQGYEIMSAFQNEKMFGWIHIKNDSSKKYYIAITDVKGHGIEEELEKDKITTEDVSMEGAKADMMQIIDRINDNEDSYYCIINN